MGSVAGRWKDSAAGRCGESFGKHLSLSIEAVPCQQALPAPILCQAQGQVEGFIDDSPSVVVAEKFTVEEGRQTCKVTPTQHANNKDVYKVV